MPSQVQSISPFGIAGGVVVGLLAVALVGFGYYIPSPVVGTAIALLALVVALWGVKPFGDTMAYHLLQAAAFGIWGLTTIVWEELTVIPVVFVFTGLVGILHYGRRAARQGIWTPASQ